MNQRLIKTFCEPQEDRYLGCLVYFLNSIHVSIWDNLSARKRSFKPLRLKIDCAIYICQPYTTTGTRPVITEKREKKRKSCNYSKWVYATSP